MRPGREQQFGKAHSQHYQGSAYPMRFHIPILVPIGILLVAGFLRWAAPESTPMWGDQAFTLGTAMDLVHAQALPLIGMKSSAHVYQTALWIYLTAIPLSVVMRIIGVRWFYSALDLLALSFFYTAMRKSFGTRAALLGAWLYAVHPWILEYNRWIWNPGLLMTAAAVTFSAFLMAMGPPSAARDRWIVIITVGAAVVAGLHIIAFPWMLGVWSLAAFIALKSHRWRGLFLGILISVAIHLPYLIYLLGPGLQDLHGLLSMARDGEKQLPLAMSLTMNLIFVRGMLQPEPYAIWRDSVVSAPLLDVIMPAVLLIAVITGLCEIVQRTQHAQHWALMFAWTLVPPIPVWLSSIHPQYYYMLHMFPAPIAAVSTALLGRECPITRWGNIVRFLRWILLAGCLALSIWWVYIWAVRIRLEDQRQLIVATPAWAIEKISSITAEYLRQNPNGVVVILEDSGLDLSAYDVIRAFVRSDRVRVVPARAGIIVPHAPGCYILTPGIPDDELRLAPLVDLRPMPPPIPGAPSWRMFCWASPPRTSQAKAGWVNGLRLLDARTEGDPWSSDLITVIHQWEYVGQPIRGQLYLFFNHLMSGDRLIAQADGPGIHSFRWRTGDQIITRFRIPLPPERNATDYTLWVGLYELDGPRIPMTNGQDRYMIASWKR